MGHEREEQRSDEVLRLCVEPAGAGQRLDQYLPAALKTEGHSVSRAEAQRWIKEGVVTLNGDGAKPRTALTANDVLEVRIPEAEISELLPEEMTLSILFEDEDLIVVDKPPGLVVHPGSGNTQGTLVNGLLHHCGTLCELAGDDRPGIVHRLDKDTSGCLVAAKSEQAYRSLVAQFSARETNKQYLAVTQGIPVKDSGHLETRMGRHPVSRQRMTVLDPPAGKEAITDYEVLTSNGSEGWAVLRCVIHTGRTHQIRVHLKECLKCPILGDVIYGNPRRETTSPGRLMLHAHRLAFSHPATQERVAFEAEIPEAFEPFMRSL